jgi:hypothetical protein
MSAYTACVGRSRKKQGHEPGIVLDVPGQGQGSPNQLRICHAPIEFPLDFAGSKLPESKVPAEFRHRAVNRLLSMM